MDLLQNINPKFAPSALACIEETSADWRADLAALRSGAHTAESLLEHCLDGVADDDRADGWREYVRALATVVAGPYEKENEG